MSYQIYLKRGEDRRLRSGHSWVYANEVARIEGKDKNGSLASVFTFDGKFVGKGYINHLSKILTRLFIFDENETDSDELFASRLKAAADYRKKLGYDNCCRLVFAEADNLPALIIDKYDKYLVAQFLSLAMDKQRERIVRLLVDLFHPLGIYERSDVAVRQKEGLEETTGLLYGEVPDEIIIDENGVKMSVDVKRGQKTGYFLDQKENRLAARKYAVDADVLDCFSNSGGFSMNVARVAKSVLAVDISKLATGTVERNAALNGFGNVSTLTDDVFEVLRRFKAEGKKFDTVILDPPAFCKSADEVKDAYRGYKDINILGMKLVREGGFLITSSCSHYMTFPLFEKMLAEAAKESGRKVRTVEIKSQAPDHPSLLCADETQYLKFFVLQIL